MTHASRCLARAAAPAAALAVALTLAAGPRVALAQAPAFRASWPLPASACTTSRITTDPSGAVFVTRLIGCSWTMGPSALDKYTPAGALLASGTSIGDAIGLRADANGAVHVLTYEGNMNVPKGRVLTFTNDCGALSDSTGDTGLQLDNAQGLAVNAAGYSYVGNRKAWWSWATEIPSTVLEFTATGSRVRTLLGRSWPHQYMPLDCDARGDLYVAESEYPSSAWQINRYAPDSTFLGTWGHVGVGALAGVTVMTSFTVAPNGHVFLVNAGCQVMEFDERGTLLATWGSCGSGEGQFQSASDLAVDRDGDVFVLDSNLRVLVFSPVATPAKTSSWGRLKAAYR